METKITPKTWFILKELRGHSYEIDLEFGSFREIYVYITEKYLLWRETSNLFVKLLGRIIWLITIN